MAIVAPIAGAYTGVWAGSALNYTRQGYNISFTHKGERVEETDLYGLSLIEIFYRGAAVTIDTVCKVYGASTRSALWPWVATFGAVYTAGVPISAAASVLGQALVLTAVANTPAATNPATFTASKTILSPDQNMQIVFDSRGRDVPLRWDVLLTDSAGTGSLFSVT